MEKKQLETLLHNMTLEEKLGQLTQLVPHLLGLDPEADVTGPLNEMHIKPEWLPETGSTLNAFGAKELRALQDRHMAKSRLHIPLLFMADIVHGYRTGFPIPLAIGCSFRPELYELASRTAAREGAASGVHLTFAPMTDLVRDPRWGRVMESTGEDAFLNSEMTKAAVRGFQGKNIRDRGSLAACVKHFAGYGAPWGGREYNTVDISEGMLREYYLPAYKAAVDEGVAMVMSSFNTVFRTPSSANGWLLRKVLREEWGFEGPVISDFAAVDETISHGVAADGKEAAQKCLAAGTDIEMMSVHYLTHGEELVREGSLPESVIDEAVMRVLTLKNDLGLFENPYKDADEVWEAELRNSPEHAKAAYDVAVECPVLLKNEGVLPLKARPGLKIGLAGPFAGSDDVRGGWAIGADKQPRTLAASLREALPDAELVTAMTEPLGALQDGFSDVEDRVAEALEALRDCDVLIAAVGEHAADTGEGASKTCLRLSENQERLLHGLHSLGKPVVAVIFSGRPLELTPVLPDCGALLQGWFLGQASGQVLADLLTGRANPSGRLSMSFPRNVGQIPVHYDAFRTGRPVREKPDRYVSRYLDCPNEPLFPFGYGLSYSKFAYSGLEVRAGEGDTAVLASVTVQNVSDTAGKETVQLYIRDVSAGVVRPVLELRGFRKIDLAPGESCRVDFALTREQLGYWNGENVFVFEPGDFDILIGPNSAELMGERLWIGGSL